jgi:hypothetical protein
MGYNTRLCAIRPFDQSIGEYAVFLDPYIFNHNALSTGKLRIS